MFWLTLQMWTLLTAAFLIGITAGWWIFKARTQEIYSSTPVYDEYDDYVSQRNRTEDDELDGSNQSALSEVTATPVERQKIYESDDLNRSQQQSSKQSENLADLPDILPDTQDVENVNTPEQYAPIITDKTLPTSDVVIPQLFSTPINGEANDLKKIKGIGNTLEKTLNGIGVYYYRQIASWGDDEIAWIDNQIDFPGRVHREKWVEQATTFENEGNSLAKEAAYFAEARDIDAIAIGNYEDNILPEDKDIIMPPQETKEDISKSETPIATQSSKDSSDTSPHQETIEGSASDVTPTEQAGDDDLPESMLDRLRARHNKNS